MRRERTRQVDDGASGPDGVARFRSVVRTTEMLPRRRNTMSKRMLIDGAHSEEIRVVVTSGTRLDEYDIETTFKKQDKGNIYLAKVTRVEPSLQAAFVDFGGNRHGFLAFSEIHPDYYQIPVDDRQALIDGGPRGARAS
jgi:ribonuclease E